MNISMAGAAGSARNDWAAGIQKSAERPVEPMMRAGAEGEPGQQEGQGRHEGEPGQQEKREQQEQTPFGRLLEDEFMRSLASGVCPNCGSPVYQNKKGRRKKFCCEACRFEWKNRHPKPENWSSTREAVCPVCGRKFLASREYGRKRKYCSRACANTGRAAERRMASAEQETGGEQ